jgi:hypothetical protein
MKPFGALLTRRRKDWLGLNSLLKLGAKMNRRTTGRLKKIHIITSTNAAALVILVAAFSGTAMAQCGASLNAMAAASASLRSQSRVSPSPVQKDSSAVSNNAVNTSIVGFWHVRFLVGDQTIQEAFQIWNAGGTEVHNPNVDPRQGNVCLGAWKEAAPQTFKLTHRVWLYDTNGNFQGVGYLTESLTLGDRGTTHSGTFTLDIHDLSGNFLVQAAAGTVVGERISPN